MLLVLREWVEFVVEYRELLHVAYSPVQWL